MQPRWSLHCQPQHQLHQGLCRACITSQAYAACAGLQCRPARVSSRQVGLQAGHDTGQDGLQVSSQHLQAALLLQHLVHDGLQQLAAVCPSVPACIMHCVSGMGASVTTVVDEYQGTTVAPPCILRHFGLHKLLKRYAAAIHPTQGVVQDSML